MTPSTLSLLLVPILAVGFVPERLRAQDAPGDAAPAKSAEPAPAPEPALPGPAASPAPAQPAAAPAPADAAPAPVAPAPDAESPFEAWLTHPASAAVPPREDVEKYLGNLQKRQQDLEKILSFLVDKKRLKKEAAMKEGAGSAVPADLTMEHWDELAQLRKDGSLSLEAYSAGLAAIAGKLRTLNWAQETLSHKCAQMMLHQIEETPVRRARPASPEKPQAGTAGTPVR